MKTTDYASIILSCLVMTVLRCVAGHDEASTAPSSITTPAGGNPFKPSETLDISCNRDGCSGEDCHYKINRTAVKESRYVPGEEGVLDCGSVAMTVIWPTDKSGEDQKYKKICTIYQSTKSNLSALELYVTHPKDILSSVVCKDEKKEPCVVLSHTDTETVLLAGSLHDCTPWIAPTDAAMTTMAAGTTHPTSAPSEGSTTEKGTVSPGATTASGSTVTGTETTPGGTNTSPAVTGTTPTPAPIVESTTPSGAWQVTAEFTTVLSVATSFLVLQQLIKM